MPAGGARSERLVAASGAYDAARQQWLALGRAERAEVLAERPADTLTRR